jgi:uncharacterized protein (TIGR02757 family)
MGMATGHPLQLRLAAKAGQSGVFAAVPRRVGHWYFYFTFTIVVVFVGVAVLFLPTMGQNNNYSAVIKLLQQKAKQYNNKNFITTDPISIPHQFTKLQDVEIAALFAATLAWGNRTTIINNCNKLMRLMDNAPYQFITQHQPTDLKRFLHFVHRTFNATDLLYFITFLQHHYATNNSLETAFSKYIHTTDASVKNALIGFNQYFFSLPHYPTRTHKHVATPARKSACKRLNMLLRWLVRTDAHEVDFGLWKNIKMHQLICPLDVHVSNTAFILGILPNKKANWDNAFALTQFLKTINPTDPAVFDYALFSLSAEELL